MTHTAIFEVSVESLPSMSIRLRLASASISSPENRNPSQNILAHTCGVFADSSAEDDGIGGSENRKLSANGLANAI
jgi:hypothetical protein